MSDTLSVLKSLFAGYPNTTITKETVAVYVEDLSDIPPDELHVAIRQARRQSKFLPTTAEIIETHRLITQDLGKATPEEEWEKVMREVRRIGSWGAPHFDNEITKRVIESMGWLAICGSSTPGVDRRQFIDLYNGLSLRGEQAAKLMPEARQLAARKFGMLSMNDSLRGLLTNGDADND